MEHRLAVAAHVGQPHHRRAIASDHAGDQGVKGSLARREAVGMVGIGVEVGAAILEHHAGARRDHSRAEAPVEALDHREDVPPPVGDDEAGGVPIELAPRVHLGLVGIELGPPVRRIVLGEHGPDGNARQRSRSA